MTVTLISDTFNTGNGTTVSAMCFAQQLRRRGHTVRVVACGRPEDSGPDAASGFEMYYVPELWVPLATHLAHKQDTLFAKPVHATLTQAITGANVVHIYQPWPLGGVAARIARRLQVPCIAAFHIQPENITYNLGLAWCKPAAHFVYWALRVLFYGQFSHIHCPSTFIAAQLRSHGYKAWLHVISNGVHSDFRPGERPTSFEDRRFHVIMVGRLSPEKRQDILLRALQQARHADEIQLHLAGRGPKAAKLTRMGRKLANPPDISHYSRAELLALLRKCHLYVHASDVEIEGMGCTEAFSCGLVPVISDSKYSATGQFALEEENLFKAGSAASLAQAIDWWIEHPEQLAKAKQEYLVYAKNFTLESSVRQMESVYAALSSCGACRYRQSGVKRFFSRLCTTFLAIPLLFVWTRLVLGVRMTGAKNLRGLSGALTVCNHVHTLDSALVGTALFPRKIAFPTLPLNLNTLFPGALVNLFGGVPVPQKASEMKPFFDEMEMRLLKGEFVHFFPEGHLDPYNPNLRAFKKGAFRLAAKARVPIVPMTIAFVPPRGMYRLLRRKPVMRLTVGKPVYPVSSDAKQDETVRLKLVRGQMEQSLTRPG